MNSVAQNLDNMPFPNGLASSRMGPQQPAGFTNLSQSAIARGLPSDGYSPRGFALGCLPTTSGGTGQPGGFPGAGGSSAAGGAGGGFIAIINNLISGLRSLIGQLTGESNAEGPGTQTVNNGTFASTGDPHLSETGTVLDSAGNSSAVNSHFDSMSSHDNLLSSQDFDGGYRLSTAVTAPGPNGVTKNASATVHMNSNADNVTLNNDGSFAITSNGNNVALAAGQSATLNGGEQVTRNTDGSLTVLATNEYGGRITTTLAAKSGGVDATATVRNATVGGDIASGTADPAPPLGTPNPTPSIFGDNGYGNYSTDFSGSAPVEFA